MEKLDRVQNESTSKGNSEDSLLVIYVLNILKKYSSPKKPLSSQDVMEYLKEDYSIGYYDKAKAESHKKKVRRHLDTLYEFYENGCIKKVEGKTRGGHRWFYDASKDNLADEVVNTSESLSGVEIDFIVDMISACRILNSASTIALIDKLLKKTDCSVHEIEQRLSEIRGEKWAKSLNAELVSTKEALESYRDKCCVVSFDYDDGESVLASPCDVLFRDGKYILDAKVGDEYRQFLLEKIKNLKKTNLPYDFDDEYFDNFDDGDEPDDTTLETLFLNIPVIKDSIKKKIGIVFKYLSYAIENDEVVLVGKDKRVLPHSLVFNDGKYYLIGYDEDSAKIEYYRVDLISKPEHSKTKINISDWNVRALEGIERAGEADKHPLMLSGIDSPVTFLVAESALDRVIDTFGKSAKLKLTKETKAVPVDSSIHKWSENRSDAEFPKEKLVAVKVRSTYEEAYRWALANADAVELVYPPNLRYRLRRIAAPIHRTYVKTMADKVRVLADRAYTRGKFSINPLADIGEDLALESFKLLLGEGKIDAVSEITIHSVDAEQTDYVSSFTRARKLDIFESPCKCVKWASDLTELVNVTIAYTHIEDLSWMEGLKKLKAVRLIDSPISDVSVLKEQQNLLRLELRNLDIRDVRFIESLHSLLNLRLVGCPVEDYSPLLRMNPLDYLEIDEKAVEALGMENLVKHHPDAKIEVRQKIDNRKV